jgi:hypothetical protein
LLKKNTGFEAGKFSVTFGTLLGASHIKIILDILYAKWVTIAENAKMS